MAENCCASVNKTITDLLLVAETAQKWPGEVLTFKVEMSPARIPIFCFAERIDLVSRLPGDKSLSTVYVLEDSYHHRSFRGNQEGYSCLGLEVYQGRGH